jgi:hypothetical protein
MVRNYSTIHRIYVDFPKDYLETRDARSRLLLLVPRKPANIKFSHSNIN